jgi:ubiquilin
MREQMRSQDRTMANIESHPEGFNALRRMYENFQEPLMDAATGQGNSQQDPLAALLGGAAAGGNASTGKLTCANSQFTPPLRLSDLQVDPEGLNL